MHSWRYWRIVSFAFTQRHAEWDVLICVKAVFLYIQVMFHLCRKLNSNFSCTWWIQERFSVTFGLLNMLICKRLKRIIAFHTEVLIQQDNYSCLWVIPPIQCLFTLGSFKILKVPCDMLYLVFLCVWVYLSIIRWNIWQICQVLYILTLPLLQISLKISI